MNFMTSISKNILFFGQSRSQRDACFKELRSQLRKGYSRTQASGSLATLETENSGAGSMETAWRASEQMKNKTSDGRSPPAKRQAAEADAAASGEPRTPRPADSLPGERAQAAGSAPQRTEPKTRDGSSGSQAPRKGGTKGKGKGSDLADLQDQVTLLKKATLANHDAIRELQNNLEYVCIYGNLENPILKAHYDEGRKYFELKKQTLQELEKASGEERAAALKALGPASASQFLAVVETTLKQFPDQPTADTPELAHWNRLKELNAKLQTCDAQEATKLAGTWVSGKAHGSNRKITAKPTIHAAAWSSLIYFLKKSGLRVFQDKAPRDGLHRAIQGSM